MRNPSLVLGLVLVGCAQEGADGMTGLRGPEGLQGPPGADGVSPMANAEPPGAACPEGGIKITFASSVQYVCNGGKGDPGVGAGGWSMGGDDIYTVTPGKVGIGTSTPSAKLHVAGDTAVTGNVGIGTATPTAKLHVEGDAVVTGNLSAGNLSAASVATAGGKTKRDIFAWQIAGNQTPLTVHFKSTWRTNNSAMYRFVFEGYNYGAARPVNSDCVGYLYSASDSIVNGFCTDYAAGIALTQYKSSDGYLVLKATMGSTHYYAGFGVSLQQFNPVGVLPTPTFTVATGADL